MGLKVVGVVTEFRPVATTLGLAVPLAVMWSFWPIKASVVLFTIGTPAAAPMLAVPENVRFPEMTFMLVASLAVTVTVPSVVTVAPSAAIGPPSI